jgi:integrating conjugative element protein (TIGR03761 family)
VVPDTEASVQAGGLIDDEPDAMVLHTQEAHRLFMGRARDPQGNLQPIVGGKRVAAALRSIWYLSGNDNPYADWALIDTGERIQQLKAALDELGRECDQRLEAAARKGLIFSILKSREPVSLELGFRSPYGYTVAGLIVEFDYRVRQVKTLVRKDLMTDDEGRQAHPGGDPQNPRRIRDPGTLRALPDPPGVARSLPDRLAAWREHGGRQTRQGGDRHLRRGAQGGLHRCCGATA